MEVEASLGAWVAVILGYMLGYMLPVTGVLDGGATATGDVTSNVTHVPVCLDSLGGGD